MIKISFSAERAVCKFTAWLCILALIAVFTSCNGTAHQESTVKEQPAKTYSTKPATDSQAPSGWQSGQPSQATTEIIVKLQPNTSPDIIVRIQAELQLKTIQILSSQNIYVMQNMGKSSIDSIIVKVREYEGVIHAEPNYRRRTN
ncbi:MAG: hypothetical protein QNI92_09940 [Desulfobacterales bacterium]|nr:hypothetical protein [Desulfobacterales bacterium]MDJ0913024.1 hypothetical protein [Desulfobacterales bacterium]